MKKVLFVITFLLLLSGKAYAAEENYSANLGDSAEQGIYIKTPYPLLLTDIKKETYGDVIDTRFTYKIRNLKAKNSFIAITKRDLPNGDYFLFTEIKNTSSKKLKVELLINQNGGVETSLQSFEKYPVKHGNSPSVGYDPTTYPVGLLELKNTDQLIQNYMIGKAYYSRELEKTYKHGSTSKVRELIKEENPLTIDGHAITLSMKSEGKDIVDQWLMVSKKPLFENNRNLQLWMQESAVNYRKTNAWYTANGPYNKMVDTIEPLPASKLGYGRTLLLLKEDRALQLYRENGERYFYNLLYNSLANLDKFKGNKLYWETEVTSTYLKNLYGITAPFIDTRFNEQTALFLKGAGETLGIEGLEKAFYDYADLLIFQAESGNIINTGNEGYFIPDYFAVNQNVKTHMSLNHGLGGMNLLLEAYLDSGKSKYLETAKRIQIGLETEGEKWIRQNEDLWYKVNPDLTYHGTDYVHLTLLDLLKTYALWSKIDNNHNIFIDKLIRSKVAYLKNANISLTLTIKNHLKANGFEELIY
ncbi:hypothetical protein [Cytobacillus oceanisediminis]|uniref:hypothetical protein n=1 Tax=Cytobacillus oceanisediminis TaxID=665099 RepID=UPI00373521DA